MVFDRDAQLRVFLSSGRSRSVRTADRSHSERSQSQRHSDRLDQHDAIMDARGDDGRRRVSRRPVQPQMDHNPLAHRLVADDRVHGFYRRFHRRVVLPLDRHRSVSGMETPNRPHVRDLSNLILSNIITLFLFYSQNEELL